MARFEPPTTEVTDPFWAATKDHTYLVQWCMPCDQPIFFPREVCPACLSADGLAWRTSSGHGTVHAVSVQHRPGNPTMADRVPYAVALVDLEEGVRLMSNVVGCAAADVHAGMAVQVTWEALEDGRHLPQFEPVPGGRS